jgi:predicted nucleic acid-binding protein
LIIVLDTNVVSESILRTGDPRVTNWMDQQARSNLYLTVISAAELAYGVFRLPDGRRRVELEAQVTALLVEDFADRILSLDLAAAQAYASIIAQRQSAGRPIATSDAQIAGICLTEGATLATRNVKDFEGCGVRLLNPWE